MQKCRNYFRLNWSLTLESKAPGPVATPKLLLCHQLWTAVAEFQLSFRTLWPLEQTKQYHNVDVFILSQGRVKPIVQVSSGVFELTRLRTLTQGRSSEHMLKLMLPGCEW